MDEFLTAFQISLIIEITWVLIKNQIPGLPMTSSKPRDSVSRLSRILFSGIQVSVGSNPGICIQ